MKSMARSPLFPWAILSLAMFASPPFLTGETASAPGETAPATPIAGAQGLRVETLRATDGSKRASMTVDADIPKTEVYVDGEFRGRTPLALESVNPGILRLTLRKKGFWAREYPIEIKPGETKKIYAELARARGVLAVTNAIAETEIVIDGKRAGSARVELDEGEYTVIVRAFGYLERKTRVSVSGNGETTLDGALERAPFSVSGAKLVRKSFNPGKSGDRGVSGVSFEASGPGRATVRVLDGSGIPVRAIEATIAARRQTLLWDGKDGAGNVLPDGEYTLELRATGDDGSAGARSRATEREAASARNPGAQTPSTEGEPIFRATTKIVR